ncbi:hypothetical protein QF049_003478 [Paenibacillus sp. W4I10]|uniref:hypothetical protein n=1 Tax=Paenibacillus sp. W4I10 TaxID=3042298 RepID=UPI00277EFFDE|nr:hypothetical protein [Paenibacillus sp. W4I10]MDQ0722217.1 hypothetical protein [Paenibacillus sp. W4I10]
MKAVPKVNTEGLYIEDELVDDAFFGVVPFYAEPEPDIAGYIVGIPVPAGLFHPHFNLEAWDDYQTALQGNRQESLPALWSEGLSQEEIDELIKSQPEEPSELDYLKQRLAEAEAKNTQLTEESTLNQVALMELHAMILAMA